MFRSESDVEIYQADPLAKHVGERKQDVHCRVEAISESLIAAAPLIKLMDEVLKHGQDGGRGIAGLELGGKRVRE